jgi:SAM-dependent methyltransferase
VVESGREDAMADGHPPLPRVIRDYEGWLAISMLALGRETGMLAAVLDGPLTAAALAAKAGVDVRNAASWLAAMTAHGYLAHQDGTFSMNAEEVAAFREFPYDLEAVVAFTRRCAPLFPALEEAIRTGEGVEPAVFHAHLGDAVGRIPVRLYEMAAEGWLEQAGVADVLRAGGSLLELAPGSGGALLHLAGRFPAATFVGHDLDGASVRGANLEAKRRGLSNVTFEVGDVNTSGPQACHDVVLILDAFHHFGNPSLVLRNAGRALRPGGRIVVAESTASGDVAKDVALPFARILMSADLLYCRQEGLHGKGAGLGTTYGTDNYRRLLLENGFTAVTHHDTEAGFTLLVGMKG